MTRQEKLEYCKTKGAKYDSVTGKLFGFSGKEIVKTDAYGYTVFSFYYSKKIYYIKAHQLVWYLQTGNIANIIDHLNGIKNDNRFVNLFSGTQRDNCRNMKGIKGYSYNKKTNKYQSRIIVDYETLSLGTYNTEEEAHKAYLDAKKIYHII